MKNIKELAIRVVNVILGRPDPNLWFCEGCGWSHNAWPCEINIAIRNKAQSGWCLDCEGKYERPCHICGELTFNTGAPTCSGCWADSEWVDEFDYHCEKADYEPCSMCDNTKGCFCI